MAYVNIEYPKFAALTDDGLLAEGYKLYTYIAGTSSTDATTYYDRDLGAGHANTNPIILDARGECLIFADRSIKLVLKTDVDVQVWEQDYVGEILSTFYVGSSAGTTGNIYNVTASPVPSALTANMTVVFTPDVTNTDTLGTFTFTGTGANDAQINGPYVGSTSSTFRVEIDANGSPDTFKWRKDSGAYVTGVAITGADQTLVEGMTVKFSVLTGHTIGDYWTQAVTSPAKLNLNGLGAKLIYKNMGGSIEAIAGGDIIADYPATLTYSAVQDSWILNNPATEIQDSDANVGIRDRTEKVDTYTLTATDKGNLIDFANATGKTLTLLAAANYNGMFFYVRAGGAGTLTIDAAGAELIYGKRYPAGNGTYTLYGGRGETVQLQCNGVSWEVLTETGGASLNRVIYATPGTFTYTRPLDVLAWFVQMYAGGSGAGNGGDPLGFAGGYTEEYIAAAGVTSVTVTVGAGGAFPLGAGGTSSFGAYCSATPGTQGGSGTGVGGDINLTGYAATAIGPYGGVGGYGGGGIVDNAAGTQGIVIIWEIR